MIDALQATFSIKLRVSQYVCSVRSEKALACPPPQSDFPFLTCQEESLG
jgi:hypothetical protein